MKSAHLLAALAIAGAPAGGLVTLPAALSTSASRRAARQHMFPRAECMLFDDGLAKHRVTGQTRRVRVRNIDGVEFTQGSRSWVVPEWKAVKWLRNAEVLT